MNLVKQHPAYKDIKQAGLIGLVVEEMKKEPNFCFQTFTDLIPELAEDFCTEWRKDPKNALMTDEELNKMIQKTKGNLFEIFTMFTLQYFETNAKVGITRGTYEQIPDEDDCGLDFLGVLDSTGKRVFGQIKFRADHPNNAAFGRVEYDKLIGEAYDQYDFDKKTECLMLVTNQTWDNAIKPRLKEKLGGAPKFDFKHGFVKFIDGNVFNDMIDYGNKRFWDAFAEEFAGDTDVTDVIQNTNEKEKEPEQLVEEQPSITKKKRNMPPCRFDKLGIKRGTTLLFSDKGKQIDGIYTLIVDDKSKLKCTVADEKNMVEYNNKLYTVGGWVNEVCLKGLRKHGVDGWWFICTEYNNQAIAAIRHDLVKNGKY